MCHRIVTVMLSEVRKNPTWKNVESFKQQFSLASAFFAAASEIYFQW